MTSSQSLARARRRSPQVARDFGISESCLNRWLKMADRDDGLRPGLTTANNTELKERRNKLLEQENEVLRKATAYFARDALPK